VPIQKNTPLALLPALISNKIQDYNLTGSRTSAYNKTYENFIIARQQGIKMHLSIGKWVQLGSTATTIHRLLESFGMNSQRSELVTSSILHKTLSNLPSATLNWIQNFKLPLSIPPCKITNTSKNTNLSIELDYLFTTLSAPGAVTKSGGYVAASKTLHCLFPELAPMIDGRHTGTSYFHIDRASYTPPLGLTKWEDWNGSPLHGVANPSPKGAGRSNWDSARFIAAIGVNQHIFELWKNVNTSRCTVDFLALDPTPGTTGLPRVIDKLLW
jgi:hypothetical protein